MYHYPVSVANYKSPTLVLGTVWVVAALFLARPAQAGDLPKAPNIEADATLAAMVPRYYRDKGTIIVAVNPDVAPIKFVDDDGNIAGFTPDLLLAVADVLKLKLQFTQAAFDALIPGLSANRFDVLLSLGDMVPRHKIVTFVDYLNVGETVVASPGRNISLKSLDDMCGLKVAVVRGSVAVQESATISEACIKDRKKPLEAATYPDGNMTLLSLSTGVSEVAWVDSPAGYYNANKFPGKYKIVYFSPLGRYGIGFTADEKGKQLAAVVQRALLELQKDGIYDHLLKKWGLPPKDGEPLFPVNGARQ
jgi:polar amino acid transport system substrate-binding protein